MPLITDCTRAFCACEIEQEDGLTARDAVRVQHVAVQGGKSFCEDQPRKFRPRKILLAGSGAEDSHCSSRARVCVPVKERHICYTEVLVSSFCTDTVVKVTSHGRTANSCLSDSDDHHGTSKCE